MGLSNTSREHAQLQGLPDTFQHDEREGQAYKQFGNGVNCDILKMFAQYMFGDEEVQARFRKPESRQLELF